MAVGKFQPHDLLLRQLPRELRGFMSERLDRLSGINGLGRIHPDQPDGTDSLDVDCVAVNDTLDELCARRTRESECEAEDNCDWIAPDYLSHEQALVAGLVTRSEGIKILVPVVLCS
jgi:hypothetical protein